MRFYFHEYFQKINVLHLALTWQWEFLELGNSPPSFCSQVELCPSEGRARNGRDKRARTHTRQARLTGASIKPILTKTNGAVYSFTWICRLLCRKLNIYVRSNPMKCSRLSKSPGKTRLAICISRNASNQHVCFSSSLKWHFWWWEN